MAREGHKMDPISKPSLATISALFKGGITARLAAQPLSFAWSHESASSHSSTPPFETSRPDIANRVFINYAQTLVSSPILLLDLVGNIYDSIISDF